METERFAAVATMLSPGCCCTCRTTAWLCFRSETVEPVLGELPPPPQPAARSTHEQTETRQRSRRETAPLMRRGDTLTVNR